ncbi:MAG: SOS response-associated peptidase [Elainellaceae cyanobacterium]
MCGRFTLTASAEIIADTFDLTAPPEVKPRYNIAPSQPVVAIIASDSASREASYFRWGLVPFWAKDPKIGYRLINARSETVAEKPAFRQAFARRRCLIVADGFYEWQVKEGQKQKQPFYFYPQDHQPFGFAGLWERWQSPEGEETLSCTILTGAANEVVEPVHHRMPIVIRREDYDQWLDAARWSQGTGHGPTPLELQDLIATSQLNNLVAHPVSTAVNSPRYDQPECVEQVAALNSK